MVHRSCFRCSQICSEAVSDGVGLRALLKPQGSCCSSGTEPSDWFRPRMSVLATSLAKSGCRTMVIAVIAVSMQLWSQVDLPMVTVLQHRISVSLVSGHGQRSVRVPLNTELPQQCVPSHKINGHSSSRFW